MSEQKIFLSEEQARAYLQSLKKGASPTLTNRIWTRETQSARFFAKENELDPVRATNNLRGLAAKNQVHHNVSQVNGIVNQEDSTVL